MQCPRDGAGVQRCLRKDSIVEATEVMPVRGAVSNHSGLTSMAIIDGEDFFFRSSIYTSSNSDASVANGPK